MKYTIALWLSPHSSGAEIVSELSYEDVIETCRLACVDSCDDNALAAVMALMVRSHVAWVYAAMIESRPSPYHAVALADYARVCPYGCEAGSPVCELGRQLVEEGQQLSSLAPEVWPDEPSDEDVQNLEAFYSVGDAYLRHIGAAVRERYM